MAHENIVMRSIDLSGEYTCVDIFLRPDGTFGFDEFRRDPEDPKGWYSIGHYGAQVFATEKLALQDAIQQVHWLAGQV